MTGSNGVDIANSVYSKLAVFHLANPGIAEMSHLHCHSPFHHQAIMKPKQLAHPIPAPYIQRLCALSAGSDGVRSKKNTSRYLDYPWA